MLTLTAWRAASAAQLMPAVDQLTLDGSAVQDLNRRGGVHVRVGPFEFEASIGRETRSQDRPQAQQQKAHDEGRSPHTSKFPATPITIAFEYGYIICM